MPVLANMVAAMGMESYGTTGDRSSQKVILDFWELMAAEPPLRENKPYSGNGWPLPLGMPFRFAPLCALAPAGRLAAGGGLSPPLMIYGLLGGGVMDTEILPFVFIMPQNFFCSSK